MPTCSDQVAFVESPRLVAGSTELPPFVLYGAQPFALLLAACASGAFSVAPTPVYIRFVKRRASCASTVATAATDRILQRLLTPPEDRATFAGELARHLWPTFRPESTKPRPDQSTTAPQFGFRRIENTSEPMNQGGRLSEMLHRTTPTAGPSVRDAKALTSGIARCRRRSVSRAGAVHTASDRAIRTHTLTSNQGLHVAYLP